MRGLLDVIGDMRSGTPEVSILKTLYTSYEDFFVIYQRYPALNQRFLDVRSCHIIISIDEDSSCNLGYKTI
jgi:hypothetical protein